VFSTTRLGSGDVSTPRVDDRTEVDVLMWPENGGLTIVLEDVG
jgi:hypothetical protein